MDTKPGYKTTEFWLVVVASVLSVAVAAGVLTGEQAQQITDNTAQVFDALAGLAAALTPLVGTAMYVWSRTRVKGGK